MTTVQSVERAFLLLDAVASEEAGLSELAARVRLPKSTAARLLKSLEGLGAVERDREGRYRIGPAVSSLTGTGGSVADLAARARPHLRLLARSLREDAGLSVPEGHGVHYIAQEDADNDIQVRDWTGAIIPMHVVPSGLVIMATWPEDALDAYLARDLERFTAHTVVEPEAIRARLARIREAGHAWVEEEFADGLNSVAAPVRDREGRVIAAVHVHGPSYRFPAGEAGKQAAVAVAEAASRIG